MKPRVLIVDDEEAVRSSLRMIFDYEGYEVFLAANGPAGLKMAEHEAPDLVILDIKMPQMDGLEVLKRLKANEPSPPVVILSGHGTVKTAVEAVKLGAFDFIEKPPESDRILIVARNALGLCVLLGLAFGATGLLTGDLIVPLLGAEGESEALAWQYFRITCIGIPLMFTSSALRAVLTGDSLANKGATQYAYSIHSGKGWLSLLTVSLSNRDRSLKLPRSSKAVQVVINDPHNSLKTHIFKVYPCRHVYYQQAINGRMFYDTFVRIKRDMGYYHLLEDALGCHSLTMLASGGC